MGGGRLVDSFFHMTYFVLESRMLAYYKKRTHNLVPIKSLVIDGNCKVEDRGLKSHHGNMIYVLCIYNKKDKNQRIMMAAFNIPEALIWKEIIESVIDQHQESQIANTNKFVSFEYKSGMDNGRTGSSSDQESQETLQMNCQNSYLGKFGFLTSNLNPPLFPCWRWRKQPLDLQRCILFFAPRTYTIPYRWIQLFQTTLPQLLS